MFDSDNIRGMDALVEAQKIAYGPVVFQCARLLRDWGIFDLLEKNRAGMTIEDIAKKINKPIYAITILCESGYSMSALKFENDIYTLTKIGYLLQNDEMTKVNMSFNHDVNYQGLFFLEEALDTGTASGLHETFSKEETIYPILSQLPPKVKESWFGFDHFYSDASYLKLIDIMSKKGIKKLLEPGGNTGKWALGLTKASKDTHVTILDHQGQIDVAMTNAKEAGVGDRVDGVAIDLLDHSIAFPTGYDAVWMSQFLDCFGPTDIVALLKRSRAALNEDGKVYIIEPLWDKQAHELGAYCLINTSPYFTALANGTSKMYRQVEFKKFVEEAGLEIEEEINGLGFNSTMLVCKIKK